MFTLGLKTNTTSNLSDPIGQEHLCQNYKIIIVFLLKFEIILFLKFEKINQKKLIFGPKEFTLGSSTSVWKNEVALTWHHFPLKSR